MACYRRMSSFLSKQWVNKCSSRCSSSQAAMRAVLREQLGAIKEAGTYKSERVISSPQGATIQVKGRQGGLINFCANNYLGLSVCLHEHMSVVRLLQVLNFATESSRGDWGWSPGSVRVWCWTEFSAVHMWNSGSAQSNKSDCILHFFLFYTYLRRFTKN